MTDRITANFDSDLGEWIEEKVESGEYQSKSKCVVSLVEAARDDLPELEDRVEDLEDQLESREERINELESQLRRRSNIEDDIESVAETVEELPARIEDTESYSERRQRKLDQATLTQRLKWRVTGVPVESDQE
jgi:predicted RNase H-like nuclease (RuvC/YqgF family)